MITSLKFNNCFAFNNKVEMFPNNIFAKIFGYKSKPMFEAKISERENVDVKV